MHKELSILIPTFNDQCLALVESLVGQLHKEPGLRWEIIVADDGSTDENVLAANRKIGQIDGCKLIESGKNIGRAAIRNKLASLSRYETLLFIDADMSIIRDNFIVSYLRQTEPVVYGGYEITGQSDTLRYRYEIACEAKHTAERRRQHPNLDFHTSNFMVARQLMIDHPIDERFRNYGYEDVFYGKQLMEEGIKIAHIDNPTGFGTFEEDADFIRKTEEGLSTLHRFSNKLRGYSRLLAAKERIRKMHLNGFVRIIGKLLCRPVRKRLCNGNAPLWLFKFYKLIYQPA